MQAKKNVYFCAKKYLLLGLILCILFLCKAAYSQVEEEMQILSLFYDQNDLVISYTRNLKPISQVAANITVITSKEIKQLNAHSLADILRRVTGIYVVSNQSYGTTSFIRVRNLAERHVLVTVDEIPWNFFSSGHAETNTIPVEIIERIEIIKGPASYSWGSSLGGIINVVTKKGINSKKASGSFRLSKGESNFYDHRAQGLGSVGSLKYYLFAGCQNIDARQKDDDPESSRYFENKSFYSKFNYLISKDFEISFSVGASSPEAGLGDIKGWNIRSLTKGNVLFTTTSFKTKLTDRLNLKANVYLFKNKAEIKSLKIGQDNQVTDLYSEIDYNEKSYGSGATFTWTKDKHTVVFGIDASYGKLEQKNIAGQELQSRHHLPPIHYTSPDITKWAIYLNDSIVLNRWAITPGIRYDNNNVADSFVSPCMGVSYKAGDNTIIRAAVARGFSTPPLAWLSGGGFGVASNSSLVSESVWSYQAGIESAINKHVWIKTIFFMNFIKKGLKVAQVPNSISMPINARKETHKGFEIEAEFKPFNKLSFSSGFSFVDNTSELDFDKVYSCNALIKYISDRLFNVYIKGYYYYWDYKSKRAATNDFIFDIDLEKNIFSRKKINTELFLSVRNIFNAAQSSEPRDENPERWFEAGVRLNF